ncbi:hypothetical protein [Actinoallomurus sp. NPDC052274]|uniref:hypothetical protein n=1 Tax=Actinoallomurus sp. NPDC052274 TaxID=3155420 RepID=UPI00341CBB29
MVTVFCGLALVSGNGFGLGGHSHASATAAASSAASPTAPVRTVTGASAGSTTVASVLPDVDGQVLAAPPRVDGIEKSGICQGYKERRNFLPLNRWTSFGLFTVDNAWIMKVRLFVSMLASLAFMFAALLWQLIGTVMGFGYTFDMVCWAAPGINAAVHDLSMWASWFLIPVWLFILAAVIKRWNSGKNGPAAAMRLLLVFLSATGMIFFMADQSGKHMDDPTAKYTVPWMARSVQGWFGSMSRSLTSLTDLGSNGATAFYDNDPLYAGNVTCAKLDDTLYTHYGNQNSGTMRDGSMSEMADGVGGMQQISKIWEITFVRSWVAAQFGDGDEHHPSPAHAACRYLESNADVPVQEKLDAYDMATGHKIGTTTQGIKRGYFIAPSNNEQLIMVAWGACKSKTGLSGDGPLPQWSPAKIDDKAGACDQIFSGQTSEGMGKFMMDLITGTYKINGFYFNGNDELSGKLGDCIASDKEDVAENCRADWNFVSGWLGANQAERITQGLLSAIIAVVFLFTLGPMAVGLTLTSVALAVLCMILPLSLILLAAGAESGKKALKATGAAAGGKFVFTLGLAFLTNFISLTNDVVHASIGNTPTPNFFQQALQGGAPLLGLFLFKRGAKWLGLGDLSKMTGMLGFAGAAMMRATNDKSMYQGAADRLSRGLGRIGVGEKRLSALDERSLQRRMINNKATRAAARGVGKGLKRAGKRVGKPVADWTKDKSQPAVNWTKDKYQAGRAAVGGVLTRRRNDLARMIRSGSPAQRAAGYAALAAGGAAVTALAPGMLTLASLPLMLGAGAAALGKTTQAVTGHASERMKRAIRLASFLEQGKDGNKVGSLKEGSAAGVVFTNSPNTAKRLAENNQRNLMRVNDKEQRRRLTTEQVTQSLDAVRARQFGANHADGYNPTFRGFTDEVDRQKALNETAAKMGAKPEQLNLSTQGLLLPNVLSFDKNGQRKIDQSAPLALKAHPANWVPQHVWDHQVINGVRETDDQRNVRICSYIQECGYLTPDGEWISPAGDVRDPAVRARIEAGGGELAKMVIKPRRPADDAMRAGRVWLGNEVSRTYVESGELMSTARDEIKDVGKVRVALPSGRDSTAEEVHVELERKCDDMKVILRQVEALHERSRSMGSADFRDRLADLNDLGRERAQEIEELTKMMRDVADASSSARNAWQVWAEVYDPAADLDDIGKAKEQIDRLNAMTHARQAEWHQELEKLLGRVSRMPHLWGDSARMEAVLDELKNKIDNRMAGEKWDNRVLTDKLESIERVFEDEFARMASDPRASSDRTPRLREMLDRMFDRSG